MAVHFDHADVERVQRSTLRTNQGQGAFIPPSGVMPVGTQDACRVAVLGVVFILFVNAGVNDRCILCRAESPHVGRAQSAPVSRV